MTALALAAAGAESGGGPDVTPNAVNWANISGFADGQNAAQTIAGISTSISLRATISSANGRGALQVYVNGVQIDTGINYSGVALDFTAIAGDQVYFRALTVEGDAAGAVTVTNLSDGGAVLDTFTFNVDG